MEDLIPNKCNYENLLSYKKTKVIFELTYYFCHTYLSKGVSRNLVGISI